MADSTNEVIAKLEKVLPCIGLTAVEADGSGTQSRHLVDASVINSTSTAACGMRNLSRLRHLIVLIFVGHGGMRLKKPLLPTVHHTTYTWSPFGS